MQKSYVFTATVNFAKDDYNSFFSLPGDTGVYDAQTGMLTVYRGGDLLSSLAIPPASITSMCSLNWMRDESLPVPAPKPARVEDNANEEIIYDKDIDTSGVDIEIAPVLTKAQIEGTEGKYEEEEVIYANQDEAPDEPVETTEIISDNAEVISSQDEGEEEVIAIEPDPLVVSKKKPGPKKK